MELADRPRPGNPPNRAYCTCVGAIVEIEGCDRLSGHNRIVELNVASLEVEILGIHRPEGNDCDAAACANQPVRTVRQPREDEGCGDQ